MASAKTSVAKQKATALATTSFSEDIEALKNRIAAPSGDKIKIENKQFKLPSGAVADELCVVIVDFAYFNAYYEGAYTKGVIESPVCFSLGKEPKGMEPSPNGTDVQCETGCDGCVQNTFGSKGKGKACQNRLRIAVLPADTEATDENTPMALLDLPPTSIKGFQSYVASVARSLQRPPYGVKTYITCDPNETYAKVLFGAENHPEPFNMEDADEAAFVGMIRGRRQEAIDRLLTEPEIQAANDTPAPAKKTALKAPVKRRA